MFRVGVLQGLKLTVSQLGAPKICRVRIWRSVHLGGSRSCSSGSLPTRVSRKYQEPDNITDKTVGPAERRNLPKYKIEDSNMGDGEQVVDKSQYVLPNDTGICVLECKTAFSALTSQEKLYAHYLSQASWYGSLICLYQTSSESPGVFLLLLKIFRAQNAESLQKVALENGLTEEEFQAFMVFAAGFFANMGNYKSFGDTKIVPNLPMEKLEKLVLSSLAYQQDTAGIQGLWDSIKHRLFSLDARVQSLGLGTKGVTTYFSDNCDIKDAELAQEFMTEKDLSGYNTRLFKTVDESSGTTSYEIRLASANTSGVCDDKGLSLLGSHDFRPKTSSEPVTIQVTRGDYAPLMKLLSDNLALAKKCAANTNEVQMLEEYIKCFTEGSIVAHKEGSRHWIRNKGPIIETYIGFIESYRDPFGVRGEFEGFVAMVNKEMSAKFGQLVEKAEHFLPLLPWPVTFEKDTFLQPDFTSLDVLMFGSSGIPAGINIPNYDDIRQSEGFKNVSLGNVLSAGYKDTKITFLAEDDKELYSKLKAASFEVQVGLHELLGHGSGKLFVKKADGTFNFDISKTTLPETGGAIEKWYNEKETWDSKFQVISSTYEECRAECVGLYLCLSSEILHIFGHHGSAVDDIIYINWLNMVRAGLLALEFYTPETCKWRQAHMQARYVILRVLLEAGEGLVSIKKFQGDDGQPDIVVHLDRSKINSIGKKAIGDFLRKLQVYKSTADYEAGKNMYCHYSAVTDEEEPHFLYLRSIVLARKQPRKMFVQCNTQINGDDVTLVEYENTPQCLVQSFADRFPNSDLDLILQQLWDKDKPYFP